ALLVAVLRDHMAAPLAGHRHVQVHAVGPLHVDVGAVVAVQALGSDAGYRERGLEAADLQSHSVIGCLVTDVGLVERDAAEGRAGARRRAAAQAGMGAALVAAEAAGDARTARPAYAEAALHRHAQAGDERV